jgi:RimJ/RimL family protein N-acetyltransferase
MEGRFCRLEPLDIATHVESLYSANSLDASGRIWTYLPYGPFASFAEYRQWMETTCCGDDPLFFAIGNRSSGRAAGVASFMRIDCGNGSIEIGHVCFSPGLQRTVAATDAIFLMIDKAFALGFRRCEWKCNALNAASRTAALRLGFSFEGIFRQAAVIKGRNRDTAWFSIIDSEWQSRRSAFEKWLQPSNFDDQGRQRARLSDFMPGGKQSSAPVNPA